MHGSARKQNENIQSERGESQTRSLSEIERIDDGSVRKEGKFLPFITMKIVKEAFFLCVVESKSCLILHVQFPFFNKEFSLERREKIVKAEFLTHSLGTLKCELKKHKYLIGFDGNFLFHFPSTWSLLHLPTHYVSDCWSVHKKLSFSLPQKLWKSTIIGGFV